MPTPIQRNRANTWGSAHNNNPHDSVSGGGNNGGSRAPNEDSGVSGNNSGPVNVDGANVNDPSAYYAHPSLFNVNSRHSPISHHNSHHNRNHNSHHSSHNALSNVNVNSAAVAAARHHSMLMVQQQRQQQQLEQLEIRRRIILMEAEHHQKQMEQQQLEQLEMQVQAIRNAQQQQQQQQQHQQQQHAPYNNHAHQASSVAGGRNMGQMEEMRPAQNSRGMPPTIEIQSDDDEVIDQEATKKPKQNQDQENQQDQQQNNQPDQSPRQPPPSPPPQQQEKQQQDQHRDQKQDQQKQEQTHMKEEEQQGNQMNSNSSQLVNTPQEDKIEQEEKSDVAMDENNTIRPNEMVMGSKPEAHAFWQSHNNDDDADTDNEADDEADDEGGADEEDEDDENEQVVNVGNENDVDMHKIDDDQRSSTSSPVEPVTHSTGKQILNSRTQSSSPTNESQEHDRKVKQSTAKPKPRLPSSTSSSHSNKNEVNDPKMQISDAEYVNLRHLLDQFCKVPLLAEYSRPVSFLHPELVTVYSSIVKHPMDLSYVCRKIRRRQYYTTDQVRIDMWRIFSNCVKFHSDTNARENAIPSFISIALHLREYFNALWQEYMLPSDITSFSNEKESTEKEGALSSLKILLERRECARQVRLAAIGTTPLSHGCLQKASDAIKAFTKNDGKVDVIDSTPLFVGPDGFPRYATEKNLLIDLKENLLKKLQTNQEYLVDDFATDIRNCVGDSISAAPLLNRLNRILGKIIVPIYEMSCRGVNQSSVWGCMAAAIWARESSKKKYWPALVLGILAPMDQREDWHKALTERNEARLPPKLAAELKGGKRRAENVLSKGAGENTSVEQMSYFLVEFMGKHEFSWVREADIIENFDPSEDPNLEKKKTKGNGPGSNARLFATAINEGKWAVEEFEMQLRDPCGDYSDDDEEDYREDEVLFSTLCESDGEDEDKERLEEKVTTTDEEEAEELFSSEGLLDLSLSGRKKAKKRLSTRKKQKENEQKKVRAEQLKKERALAAKKRQELKMKRKSQQEAASKARAKANKEARELKKLEKEREKEERKEQREKERIKRKREKEIRDEEQKVKKSRLSIGSSRSKSSKKKKTKEKSPKDAAKSPKRGGRSKSTGIPNKRARAEAVVKHFISRIAHNEEKKGLPISGMVNTPSSGIASYGLLGMSLAFRAAAGVINFPDTGKTERVLRPWEKIDVDSAPTSKERCNQLRKQIELLEKDIKKMLEYEERKKTLIEKAEEAKHLNYRKIKAMDKEARTVSERYAKTRKKSSGGSSTGKSYGNSKKRKADSKSSDQKSRMMEDSPPNKGMKDESDDENNYVEEDQVEVIRRDDDEQDDEGVTVEVENNGESDEEMDSEEENEEVEAVVENDMNAQYDDAEEDSE